jgi:foldase protein PrsA
MEQYERSWKNYYEMLQVSPKAEASVITAAYRRLAQAYHPDTAIDPVTSAKMADINEAYEVLSNPLRRSEYDRVFKSRYPSQQDRPYSAASPVKSTTPKTTGYGHVPKRRESRYSSAARKKTTVDQAPRQVGARLAVERERKGKQTVYIIVGLVVAVILIIFGVFYYQTYVAPFRRVIITVDTIQIRMDYFLQRSRPAGSDPMSMLQQLTEEQLIKVGTPAPPYGITVTDQDIDQQLRRLASSSDNITITEAEFKEWYRQRLNENKLSDSEYRELIGIYLMKARLQGYLAETMPTTVEQVHLHLIQVTTNEEAVKVKDRLTAGESFAALAQELSQDTESKENGGDIGWMPRGVTSFDSTAFSLNINEVSDPIPYSADVSSGTSAYFIIMVSEKADAREVEAKYLPTLLEVAYQNWLDEESEQHEHAWYGLDGGAFDMETYYWIMQQLAKTNPTSTSSSS